MELEILKKKLSSFRGEGGRVTKVSDDLLLEILSAWENWTGSAKEFYRGIDSNFFIEVFTLPDLREIKKLYGKNNEFDFMAFEKAMNFMAEKAKKSKEAALAKKNLERDLLLAELIAFKNKGKKPELCCQNPLKGIGKSSIFFAEIKSLFTYCGSCHSQPSIDYPLQFLYGTTEQEIKTNIVSNRKVILDSITNKTAPMPPLTSKEHQQLDRKKRSLLVKFIENLK